MTAYDEIREKYFNKSTHRPLPPRDQFYVLMAKLDTLENKLEFLINKVIDEINNGSKSKDLPLNKFFSRFCVLKGLDENHPTARTYKSRLNLFFKFLGENHPKVRNLNELKPIIISKFDRYL
ncbi:MAG: hypothetical protein ACFFBV_13630, partial [Promethearchaeota archaeon]